MRDCCLIAGAIEARKALVACQHTEEVRAEEQLARRCGALACIVDGPEPPKSRLADREL